MWNVKCGMCLTPCALRLVPYALMVIGCRCGEIWNVGCAKNCLYTYHVILRGCPNFLPSKDGHGVAKCGGDVDTYTYYFV